MFSGHLGGDCELHKNKANPSGVRDRTIDELKDMKRRSISSVLAERRKQRSAVTPSKSRVRYVKFSPEEMAYEAPPDVSDPKRFPTIARGQREWEQFLAFKRGYVRLDPELRELFKDDRAVNAVLRKVVELVRILQSDRRPKKIA